MASGEDLMTPVKELVTLVKVLVTVGKTIYPRWERLYIQGLFNNGVCLDLKIFIMAGAYCDELRKDGMVTSVWSPGNHQNSSSVTEFVEVRLLMRRLLKDGSMVAL